MIESHKRVDELQVAFLDAFEAATGLPIGFYYIQDGQPRGLFSSRGVDAFEGHCQLLRALPGGKAACEMDHCGRARNEIERGMTGLSPCHAGLYNEALRVVVAGQVRGVLLFGQVLLDDPEHLSQSLERHYRLGDRLFLSPEQIAELGEHLLDAKQYTPEAWKEYTARLPPIQAWFETLIEYEDRLVRSIEKVQHEIQTRLQAVVAHADNLVHDLPSLTPAAQTQMVQEVLYTALALATVVRSMGEEHLQDYRFQYQPLLPLITEARRLYEAEAAARGIPIRVRLADVDGRPPLLEISKHHLQYALNNLIHNAVKYSFRSGPGRHRYVLISGRALAEGYEIEIQNYGVGILPEEITSGCIFEDGTQGHLTQGEFRTGSGKGLYVVKRTIDRHQGTITVSSEEMGSFDTREGQPHLTTFRVWLPYRHTNGKDRHA